MPRDDLFRKQVYEARQNASARFGRPALVTPPAWSWILLGLGVFFVAFITFAITVDFSRKETVRGKLRYSKAEARMVVERNGTIAKIFVADGAVIKAGEPLVEVESEQYLSDGRRLSFLEIERIEAEISSLEARLMAARQTDNLARRGFSQHRREVVAEIRTSV